jgi:hypothetical protein
MHSSIAQQQAQMAIINSVMEIHGGSHLRQQGTSRAALQDLSNELLHVVRILKLDEIRNVALEEIQRASQRWARQQRSNPKAHSYGNAASFFIYAAKKWLHFHGCLKCRVHRKYSLPINSATSHAT